MDPQPQVCTDTVFWDDWWKNYPLPATVHRTNRSDYVNALLSAFVKNLQPDTQKSVLEIGGAPGEFLSWFAREFHFQAISVDFSAVGNQKTIENFQIQNLAVKVFQKDILSDDLSDIPKADVVYSLGFAEHFENADLIFQKHLECCKPGGFILIGFPNFAGINQKILSVFSPKLLQKHAISVIREDLWMNLAKKYDCKIIKVQYLGGICPRIWYPVETHIPGYSLINLGIRALNYGFSRWILCPGRINSPQYSAYWLGIFQKP